MSWLKPWSFAVFYALSTPAELDALVKQQLIAWGRKIRDAGIQPE